jgi:hypothetical protein
MRDCRRESENDDRKSKPAFANPFVVAGRNGGAEQHLETARCRSAAVSVATSRFARCENPPALALNFAKTLKHRRCDALAAIFGHDNQVIRQR